MTPDTRKILSLLLVPVYLFLIAMLLVLNTGSSYNPPILLLLFNTLFLGLIPLYVAYIAYKSFRGSGSTGVLLKGTGMLMLGLGAIAAGIVGFLPDSMNANVTVHNTSFCIGAFLQLVGILIALSGAVPRQRPGDASGIAILYGGCVLVFSSFVMAAVLGAVPPFFIQGTGFTALREFVITNAIEFFAIAAGILLYLYYRKREEFFFWYSIGLALIAIGLLAVHFPSVLGSPLGWVGRSAQYLGAVYVLIAFIALNRSAEETGIPLGEILARFFGESEASYRSLVETATDAIVVHDSAHQIIIWNRAAEEMFGYSQSEALGSSFIRLVIPDEFADVIKNRYKSPATSGTGLPEHTSVEISARRKDGSMFPVELALSRQMVAGSWVTTCIMRDITRRKQTEEKLQTILQRLYLILSSMQYGILLVTNDGSVEFANQAFCDMFGLHDSPSDLSELSADEMIEKIQVSYQDPDGAVARIGEILRAGESVYGEDVIMQGERVFLRDFIPIRLGGKLFGRLWIHSDITDRKSAEEALLKKNADLNAAYEEIISTQEELRQNVEELSLREQELVHSEANLREALAEKEILLSEIHHRVKNNLTAFISLLSLDGSYEDTEGGRALRKDLQNRARSMALIHETLYRTGKFSIVDMEIYLNTLVSQIAGTYAENEKIRTVVDVRGVALDLSRATTAGLIINELVTNSFKYAFPPGFDCMAVRKESCAIRISLYPDDSTYVLAVADNGRGLPGGFDPLATPSLGLKLVNFLARHQLRADIEVRSDRGTEFIFRLKKAEDYQ